MKRHPSLFLVPLFPLTLLLAAPARAVQVDYTVVIRPKADRIHISARLRDLPDGPVTLAMPVWIPGYYVRTNQARGVSGLDVTANGASVATEVVSPSMWRFQRAPNEATAPVDYRVEYDVRARDYGFGADDAARTLGQMGVYVDADSAFIHPGAALLYVDGHTNAPSTLALNLPTGWDVASPLPRRPDGALTAPDYDTLGDSPIQAGHFRRLAFSARGKDFKVILTGKPRVSDAELTDVCRDIATEGIDLFGGWAPFDRYQFHLHFPPKRPYPGAGLEHRASAVIVFSSRLDDATLRGPGAHLIAHEFLHAWNVKALHPEGLGPFDYQKAARTPSLWLAEGVTDYYAHLILVRAGLWTPRQALDAFARTLNGYRASRGRNATSLTDSSEGVWDAGPASIGSGGTNYYEKGLLAALLLDVQVRAATDGRRGLDDAMRLMMARYAQRDLAYPPDALLTAIREATGVDVSDAYRAYIHGTQDLPFERAAERMGIDLKTVQRPDPMLGVMLKNGAGGPRVTQVLKGSAAESAGLRPGDVLFSIGQSQLTTTGQVPVDPSGQALLAGRAVGDRVPIVVQRGTEKELVTVIVQGRPDTTLERVPSPTPAQRAVWDALWSSDRPVAPARSEARATTGATVARNRIVAPGRNEIQ